MTPRPSVCVEIEPDLVAAAVGEAEPVVVERVHAHVDRCSPCRDEFGRYRAIDGEIATLRERPVAAAEVARARERLESELLDLRSRLVAYRIFTTPLGPVLIARSEQGVVLVEYLPEDAPSLDVSRLARARGLEAVEDRGDVEALGREFGEYVAGRRGRLGWPLDLRLVRTPFHRAVLEATARVPYGAVISYKRLAQDLGRPRAVRAVAQALRWNPIPVAIPCHRVIGSGGLLTGYAGEGTARKRQLLAAEGVPVVRARDDFEIARDAMYVLMPGDTEYCLPTCPTPEKLRSGLPMFFGSRERAEAVGLEPCTTCRPDLHPLAELD